MLWYNVRNKTYRVGMRAFEIIAGLGLSGIKANVFFCYDARAETKWWWHGCSDREYFLTMGTDVGAVEAAERWDNDVVIL